MPKHRHSIRVSANPLDFIGPIIGSIFAVLVMLFFLFLLWLINRIFPTKLLESFFGFLYGSIGIIFLISLVFGYAGYFSRLGSPLNAITPLLGALGAAFIVTFIVSILQKLTTQDQGFQNIFFLIRDKIAAIFLIVLVAGYATHLVRMVRR